MLAGVHPFGSAAWLGADGGKWVAGGILEFMAFELPEEESVQCPKCGIKVPESELQSCTICHSVLCQYCAVADFGRNFCSNRCRGFFFWGDGEQDDDEGDD